MEILKENLDSDQLALAADISRNFLVLAGPGSGKTRVITHRIAYLFRSGAVRPPFRVLGITFTNKAAAEMRGRIRQISNISSQWSHVMTFHKFGENFLRSFGYLVGLKRDFVIYDEKVQSIAVKTAAKEVGFKNLDVGSTVMAIEKQKSEQGMIKDAIKALEASGKSRLARIMTIYQKILISKKAVDFSDLLCLSLEIILKYPAIKKIIQDIYKHVLVDECQDTNHVQLKLLKELFQDSESFVLGVADEDQSIYTWRGARIKNLNDFLNIFDADLINLRRNYRCHPSILKVADSLILKAPDRLKEGEFIACRPDDGKCRAYRVFVPDLDSEGLFVADMIQELKKKDLISSWRDVTVLGRNWYHLNSTAKALNKVEIPNIILNETDIPDTPEVNVLLGAIRSCVNPNDELAKELVQNSMEEAGNSNFAKFDPVVLMESPTSPIGLVKKLRRSLGFDDFLDNLEPNNRERRLEALNAFQAYCTKVSRIAPDLSAFSRVLTLEGHTDQGKEESTEDAVNLMSIHTSKGTERKVIFIAALDSEIFPRFDIEPGSERWEEERRLLYVSITRAEDYLYLIHCETRPTAKGYIRRREPSPLLLDIDETLLNCIVYP